jgi:hypothetical protein
MTVYKRAEQGILGNAARMDTDNGQAAPGK